MVDARSHRNTGTHFSGSRFSKPGILARDDASSNRHPAPSFLFEHDLRANVDRVCPKGKPAATFPDHAPGALSPKKEARPKRPGSTLCVAAQYIQKTPKNNGLFGIWLADFGHTAGPNCPFRDRDRPRAKPRRNGPSRPRCSRRSGFAAHPGCGPGSSRAGSPACLPP